MFLRQKEKEVLTITNLTTVRYFGTFQPTMSENVGENLREMPLSIIKWTNKNYCICNYSRSLKNLL